MRTGHKLQEMGKSENIASIWLVKCILQTDCVTNNCFKSNDDEIHERFYKEKIELSQCWIVTRIIRHKNIGKVHHKKGAESAEKAAGLLECTAKEESPMIIGLLS